MYDYVVVGSGLFGATFTYLAIKAGKKVLVLEKKGVVGGGIRSERRDGIDVHLYGPHIFHTSDKEVYDVFSSFSNMMPFINQPMANYKGKYFNMPFNMNTFHQMWGITKPEEAMAIIDSQIKESGIKEPKNLEEQAIKMVGKDIYLTLVKGYTEKQWGRDCKDLPPSIIKRLPVRFTYDNNYFNDLYQCIPEDGYTLVIERMLKGADILLNTDYLEDKDKYRKLGKTVIYTGEMDRYFDYSLGKLQYRTLRFQIERLEKEYYQPCAVVNYTSRDVPYTRISEHKYFADQKSPVTYICKEYSKEFEEGDDPLYPINDERNDSLYNRYKKLAEDEKGVFFAGRLGQYKYFDMDDCMREAINLFNSLEK